MAPFVSYPPEKRAIFEHECRVRAEVVANVTPAEEEAAKAKLRATWPERRAAAEAAEAASPPPPRRTGLDTDAEGPIGTSQSFAATGNWIGEVNGQWFQVYTGARLIPGTTTAVASELMVFSLPASLRSEEHPVLVGRYEPPGGGRELLKIVAYHGDVLRIRAGAGRAPSFDVADRSFVSH